MKRRWKPALCYSEGKESEQSNGHSNDSKAGPSNSQSGNQSNFMAGRIESLHMENFMCHENLEVNFDRRITFITGRNGSGKSSIMAAIVVALGGSASVTGRALGMADFIRKGATWARVTIKLNNSGTNSYKKDVYGNKITIVRTLSKTAATSYICKSESGDIISKRKEEVDKIITVLDLQIRNPICILNQDVARNFLSTADSSARFSMFMKATHLENIKQIYSETLEMLTSSQEELAVKQNAIAEADIEINRLKDKLEYFDNVVRHVKERDSIENEYHWSVVLEHEADLREIVRRRDEVEENRKLAVSSELELETNIADMETNVKDLREQLLDSIQSHNSKRDKLKKTCTESQNIQGQMDVTNLRLNQLILKHDRQSTEIDNIQKYLENSEELARETELKSEREDERHRLMIELSDLRDRLQANLRDHYNAIEAKLQYGLILETLNSDLIDMQKSNTHLLIKMKRGQEEYYKKKYSSSAPKILELNVEASLRNQYQKKPIGPCGLHVTLNEKKWARPVEFVVGALMSAYCCDNEKDFQVLSQIMKEVCDGKNPPIIINKFKDWRYNVEARKVSVPDLNAIVDVLNINDDVVFNMFVDQARIETVLLFETDEQAASMLTNVQTIPRNFSMGLTPQGDIYYAAPYRTYGVDQKRGLKYFDTAEFEMARLKYREQYQANVVTIDKINKRIEGTNRNLAKTDEFLKKCNESMQLLKQREREITDRIFQLNIEEEECPVPQTKCVLEDEMAALQKNQAELLRRIQEERENLVELARNKEENDRMIDILTVQEREIIADIANLEDNVNLLNFRISEHRNKKSLLQLKKMDVELELEFYNRKVARKKDILEKKMSLVTDVNGQRVETKRTPRELHSLLLQVDTYVRAVDEKLKDRETITREFEAKTEKYSEMIETAGMLNKVVQSLSELVVTKKEKLKLLQSHAATLVSFYFQASLQTRGYHGNLIFDFTNQTLDIEVGPKGGPTRKDTKTLSGGERSYSMISFILAIWRTIRMPFYFLDEFDVFMDKANRKAILDLILEHTKIQKNTQFVFITPHDISSVQPSDSVSIFKMPDPRI